MQRITQRNLAITPIEREPAVRGPRGEKLDFELLYSDGVPLDTVQHRLQMNLLIELTDLLMADRGRTDYYTGGDMFLYYSVEQARFIAENAPGPDQPPSPEYRQYIGPDYFFVAGAPWRDGRKVWITWQEDNRYPQVIVELTSPSTAKIDRTVKKQRYESLFKTAEYYMYRPGRDSFDAYHLGPKARYRKAVQKPALPNARTVSRQWVWSDQLGVWLGLWQGIFARYSGLWLRFYDADGRLIANQRERADDHKKRAEDQKKRADAAHAEIQRLRALLADKGVATPDPK
ncbi:MAG: Uma2 family endonuclease [Proteobacteria bacterium]|nr:Uma2 family endonuclease [Pseudomonadota bacterium]